jgi:microcystin-dependent protein
MDKLEISAGQGLPTIEHFNYLINAPEKAIANALKVIGDNFVFIGVNISESPNLVEVTEGVVCLNGEVCEVDTHSVTLLPGQVAYWDIETTYVDPSPIRFQDGVSRSVMARRKAKVFAAPSIPTQGVALNLPRYWSVVKGQFAGQLNQVGDVIFAFGVNLDHFSASGLGLPGTPQHGRAICNGNTHNGITTPDLRGVVPVGATQVPAQGAPALYNGVESNYEVGDRFGVEKVVLAKENIPPHTHQGKGQSNQFAPRTQESNGQFTGMSLQQNVTTSDGSEDGLSNVPHENRPPSIALVPLMIIGI